MGDEIAALHDRYQALLVRHASLAVRYSELQERLDDVRKGQDLERKRADDAMARVHKLHEHLDECREALRPFAVGSHSQCCAATVRNGRCHAGTPHMPCLLCTSSRGRRA